MDDWERNVVFYLRSEVNRILKLFKPMTLQSAQQAHKESTHTHIGLDRAKEPSTMPCAASERASRLDFTAQLRWQRIALHSRLGGARDGRF